MNKYQLTAIRALQNLKGDDMIRARNRFRNYTPKQMQEPYGSSRMTPAEIIAAYERKDAEIEAAIAWVLEQLNEDDR